MQRSGLSIMTSNARNFHPVTGLSSQAKDGATQITIKLADGFADFCAAMPLLRASERESPCHESGPGVGVSTSYLRHDGSGPWSGCLLIARSGETAVGCLLLWVTPQGDVAMKWLYVTPPYHYQGIEQRLMRKAFRIAASWHREIAA